MPHRKVMREWLIPLSERTTLRAIVLLVVDYVLWAALMAGTVLFESWWAKLLSGLAAGFVTVSYTHLTLPTSLRV